MIIIIIDYVSDKLKLACVVLGRPVVESRPPEPIFVTDALPPAMIALSGLPPTYDEIPVAGAVRGGFKDFGGSAGYEPLQPRSNFYSMIGDAPPPPPVPPHKPPVKPKPKPKPENPDENGDYLHFSPAV